MSDPRCTAALNVKGTHYPCQETEPHQHTGIHRNTTLGAIWVCGSTPDPVERPGNPCTFRCAPEGVRWQHQCGRPSGHESGHRCGSCGADHDEEGRVR